MPKMEDQEMLVALAEWSAVYGAAGLSPDEAWAFHDMVASARVN